MHRPNPDDCQSPLPPPGRKGAPDASGGPCGAPSDAELFSRLADGERQAWGTLYRRYWQDLVDYIVSKYRLDSHAAGDLASETLISLWPDRRRLASVRNPRAYLKGIAHRLAAGASAKPMANGLELSPSMMSPAPSPAAAAEQNELVRRLREATNSLPESHRRALEMNHEGLSARQIADASDCTEKAIRRRIQKALARIRERLASVGSPHVRQGSPGGIRPEERKFS